MAESAVQKIVDLGAEIPHWNSSKKALVRAVEDLAGTTRRVVKRSRFAVEDLVSEAAHTVKQRPLQAIIFASALALGAGAVFGWMAARNNKK